VGDDVVLDSSAVLAFLLNEAGADEILRVIERAVLSAVNLAEIRTKLLDLGEKAQASGDIVLALIRRIEPFTEQDANDAAQLRTATREMGLSLGDRACLALGMQLGAEVYTADRAWSGLEVGCNIHLIR
jgi:PIN domain nuclease of toxin-antitoxin system